MNNRVLCLNYGKFTFRTTNIKFILLIWFGVLDPWSMRECGWSIHQPIEEFIVLLLDCSASIVPA